MKTFYETTMIAAFLLLCTYGIQAQTTPTKLNQVELMKQFIGTWQTTVGKDTIIIVDTKAYGKALFANTYQVVKGKQSDLYINNYGYDDRDDKLKGFLLFLNTDYGTWIGMFTTDKLFKADGVDSFKPEIVWWKIEIEFKAPTEMIMRNFNAEGVQTGEWNYKKVK